MSERSERIEDTARIAHGRAERRRGSGMSVRHGGGSLRNHAVPANAKEGAA